MSRRFVAILAFAGLSAILLLGLSLPGMPEQPTRHAAAGRLAPTRAGRQAAGTPEVAADRIATDPDHPEKPRATATPPSPLALRDVHNPSTHPHPTHRAAPWSTDHLLADPTHMNDQYLALVSDPATGHLFAAFEAYDLGGTDRDIHLAMSTDHGATWTVTELPSSSVDEFQPDLALDDAGYIHVVWVRADGVIMRARSAGPGDIHNWAFAHTFEVNEPVAVPSIAVSGAGDFARVFIACSWYTINWDWYQHEYTLLWLTSTNGGQTVAYDYLQPDGYPDRWPDVALSGATVTMVNGEQDPNTGRIRILVSADALSGTFADYIDLTQTSTMSHGFPAVVADGDNIYLAWQLDWDDGIGNLDGDIMYAYSWDGLATAYGPYDLIATPTESVGPTLFTRDGLVGCLWLEAPTGGDEFDLAVRLAAMDGHPDFWGDVEIVSDLPTVVPQFRSAAGAVSGDELVAAWIDRRDFNTEGYNVYAAQRGRLPDLAPFTPDQWQSPLVVSMTIGAREDGILAADFPAYASLAVVNLGLADATATVETELLLDGIRVGSWLIEGGLPQATYASVEDHPLSLDAGAHTLTLRIDPANRIAESDETDNELVKELWVVSGEPRLVLNPTSLRFTTEATQPSPPPTRHLVQEPIISARLQAALDRSGAAEKLRVVVTPADRIDPTHLANLGRAAALAALRDHAQQQEVQLATRTAAPLRSLWLSGELVSELTPAEITDLATAPTVGGLWLDNQKSELFADPPRPTLDHLSLTAPSRAPWPLELLGVPAAWEQGLDGSGILVGHTDSGVAWDHPDLVGHLWNGGAAYPHHGYDFLDDDNDPYDPGEGNFWHGTHTGGLIVSASHGAAPGARLVVTRCVPGYYEDLVEALQFCLDQGCRVISSSAGWTQAGDPLRSANRTNAEILLALDVAWIVAAGNGDNYGGHVPVPDDIGSPADAPHPEYGQAGHSAAIAVGAVNQSRQVWSSSSRGPAHWDIAGDAGHDDYPYPPGLNKPDLVAPGVDIASTVGYGGYDVYSGTSMATPLVAGCAAILLQANPTLSVTDLAAALDTAAEDLAPIGRDHDSGAGLVDLPAALAALPTSQAAFVQVRNEGAVPLVISDITANVAWLDVTPAAGTVALGDSLRLSVTWDASGLVEGAYFADVIMTSNDPAGAAHLSVTLIVGEPVGAGDTPPAVAGELICYPNPFNPRTQLRFELNVAGPTTLRLYDARGRLVRGLLRTHLDAGRHEVAWDGRDDAGRPCAAGVYLARLETGGQVRTGRMLLVR